MKQKVIVAGHICIDITPAFPQRRVTKVSEILQPGKLIEMGAATVSSGGAVANTGLGMKILGADVTLMGKAGNDAFGDMLRNILSEYGAGDGLIRSDEEATSYTVVLAIPGIDRIFLHNPGANNSFYASDIPREALEEAALFHFGYPPIMRSMYQNDGEELVRIMKRAKEAGCATSLDLAAVDPESEAGKADWKHILKRTLPYVDFFVPSIEELCFMLDRERFEEWNRRADGQDVTEILDPETDIRPIADQCMELGAKVLLLKCGAPGLYLRTAEADVLRSIVDPERWGGKEIFEPSYIPDRIASGTGAGDTCIAAFLTGILDGESAEDCLHLAAAAGACCVSSYDALGGLIPLEEMKRKIAAGWEKVRR